MRLVLVFLLLSVLNLSAAHAQRSIEFADAANPGDAVVIAMRGATLPDAAKEMIGADAATRVEATIAKADFAGESGASLTLQTGADAFAEIHLIGIGEGDLARRDWEDFGGKAGMIGRSSKASRVAIIAGEANDAASMDIAFGAAIGQYSFDKYKSDATAVSGEIAIVTGEPAALKRRYEAGKTHLAEAVAWVRDMQSEPANVLYPEEFVRRANNLFRGVRNISVNVLDVRDMEQLGMGAILGVGKGSVRPPRMMIVRYNGGAAGEAPLVFAGKGITFDSGGISLKQNRGMWGMKADMTGAAVVMGAVSSLAKSKAPVNVIAIAALAENMPGGRAQRPGDVVRSMSGKTIEILSTDAEGRLVLSDAVWYAQQEYKPRLLVDVATLTGSVGGALGDEYAGLFSRDDAIADRLLETGQVAGEDLWRLPLHPNHDIQIKSFIADVKNSDTGAPGASTGAAFIGAFINPETNWAHLDIAGVDWRNEPLPTVPNGASGFGVRLLDALARGEAQ